MNPVRYGCLIPLLTLLQACSAPPPASPAKEIQAMVAEIRGRSQAFAAAEAAGDIEASLSFWLPDAEMQTEGVPPINGQAKLREMYEQFLPALESLEVKTTRLVVHPGGDLAYETGTIVQTFKSRSGPVQSTAKYLRVWKLGPGRKWLIAAGSVTGNPR